MKPIRFNLIKVGTNVLMLVCICLSARAQKAASVQEGSVWASAVRIDGKLSDWAGPLKATNKDTHLSYTMANDDKNLYLVIQSSEAANNSKIMLGGISLTVNPDGKKRIKDGFTVTFPVIARGAGRGGAQGGRGQGGAQGAAGGRGQAGGFGQARPVQTQQQRDSAATVQSRTQLAAAKEIKVIGFKSITDSLISIYNEYNVQASANIDEKGIFIYELAVPLELLAMSADKPKEFSYNIKINGLQFGGGGQQGGFGGGGGAQGGAGGRGGQGGAGAGGFGAVGRGGANGGANNAGAEDRLAQMSPTEFWGKYTLTKK